MTFKNNGKLPVYLCSCNDKKINIIFLVVDNYFFLPILSVYFFKNKSYI